MATTAKAQQDFNNLFTNFKVPSVDFNSLFSTQRRNIEALSSIQQVVAQSIQQAAKCQADATRESVENFISATKDIFSNNSPENNTTRQMNLARSWYENAVANARELSELASESNQKVLELVNKRANECMEEFQKAAK